MLRLIYKAEETERGTKHTEPQVPPKKDLDINYTGWY